MLPQAYTLWFTGLSASGKTTISQRVAQTLRQQGSAVEHLDGDVVRTHLSSELGFSKAHRDLNVQRLGWVAQLLNRHHVIAIVAAISPYRAARAALRTPGATFIEVFCDAPLDVLIARDPKGLYKKAMAKTILHFTGIDDPYEPPAHPEIHLQTDSSTPDDCTEIVLKYLAQHDLLKSFANP